MYLMRLLKIGSVTCKRKILNRSPGQILKEYMKQKQLSARAFSKQFGIPSTTVHDWVTWDEIDKTEYDRRISGGGAPTMTFRSLRQERITTSRARNRIPQLESMETDLDLILYRMSVTLQRYMSSFPIESNKTKDLITEVKRKIIILEGHYGIISK